MLHMFGELASSGLASGGGRRHSLRRGSEVGERLEHTIALTSHSSTPSAHEGGGDSGGGVIVLYTSPKVLTTLEYLQQCCKAALWIKRISNRKCFLLFPAPMLSVECWDAGVGVLETNCLHLTDNKILCHYLSLREVLPEDERIPADFLNFLRDK
ncbi:hypothetical protein ElyMa_002014500 [Elysia marginata]|uniref:Uncharacterized protein n=1 Tax=Elysia marginata TaxID=1093978 RepID=A0AAV4F6N0_9GAST|nr:hypothetical protein ElyMa_002014500 [Elysia marginata]